MRGLLVVILVLWALTPPLRASDDGPDGVIPPVLLSATDLALPKVLENARYRVKLLYKVDIKTDGSVEIVNLLLCAVRNAGEKDFADAPKAVCDPIDRELRVGLVKRKYQPAPKDGKAIQHASVIKIDLAPPGAE